MADDEAGKEFVCFLNLSPEIALETTSLLFKIFHLHVGGWGLGEGTLEFFQILILPLKSITFLSLSTLYLIIVCFHKSIFKFTLLLFDFCKLL